MSLEGYSPPASLLDAVSKQSLIVAGLISPGFSISLGINPFTNLHKVYCYLYFPPTGYPFSTGEEWEIRTKVQLLYQNSPKGTLPVCIGYRTTGEDSFSAWTNNDWTEQLTANFPSSPTRQWGETSPVHLSPLLFRGKIDSIRMTVESMFNLVGIGRMLLFCKSS